MERYFENTERFIALFKKRNESFWIEDGIIFKRYQKMLVPDGCIKSSRRIEKSKEIKLLNKTHSILLRSTSDFNCSPSESEWYAVLCDKFTAVEEYKSKQRNEINRGLKNCEIRKISAVELADNGYECYFKAFDNYNNNTVKPYSQIQFKENILTAQGFEDIVHYWGVFHDDKMIAFATNYIYGNIEASYNSIKLHPDYLHLYPIYALIYRMNEFYLKDHFVEYVNDGFRSILHDTSIQNFLIKKFGFTKVYLKLHVRYHPIFDIIMKVAFPFRKIIAKFDARFNALFELERIHRKSKR